MQLHKWRAAQARLAICGAAPVLTAPEVKLEGRLQGVNRINGSGDLP